MTRLWRSLTFKLLFTLLFTGLFGVGLVWLLANQEANNGFGQLKIDQLQAEFVTIAQKWYEANGSWDGFGGMMANPPRPPFDQPRFGQPPQFTLLDDANRVLLPFGPWHVGDGLSDAQAALGTAVVVNGRKAGTVLFVQGAPTFNPLEQRFLDQTNQRLLIGAIATAFIAIIIGIALTRYYTRPLRDLTKALRAMHGGNLEQEVPVRSKDELGELANAFNHMSKDLARANFLRRRMTADIAHDLRTPLTVIAGYVEAMQDGTLKPTHARFETMNTEIQALKRLVEDLRTLSLADAGELKLMMQEVSPEAFLHQVAASFQPLLDEQGIALRVELAPALPCLNIDRERMAQVLGNLISNSMRHTTAGGEIALGGYFTEDSGVALSVRDSGAGIAADKLPYIFERMYRADDARSGSESESGLGLAIVKSIVEAHGGAVNAESALGSGTTITVRLPKARVSSKWADT